MVSSTAYIGVHCHQVIELCQKCGWHTVKGGYSQSGIYPGKCREDFQFIDFHLWSHAAFYFAQECLFPRSKSMTTEDLNHCHWLKLLSLVHCCTPFHLCDWVMRYHRLYAPKYSCENKSGKWRELFSHSPGLIMGGWGEMTTKHPGRHHTQDAQGRPI